MSESDPAGHAAQAMERLRVLEAEDARLRAEKDQQEAHAATLQAKATLLEAHNGRDSKERTIERVVLVSWF
ncbi:MAG: hypothetical protein JNK85_09905 [Verrucomicrobiales bacterium]|nr:hypothetical protein [Verrucomicrobiales bacterium]